MRRLMEIEDNEGEEEEKKNEQTNEFFIFKGQQIGHAVISYI